MGLVVSNQTVRVLLTVSVEDSAIQPIEIHQSAQTVTKDGLVQRAMILVFTAVLSTESAFAIRVLLVVDVSWSVLDKVNVFRINATVIATMATLILVKTVNFLDVLDEMVCVKGKAIVILEIKSVLVILDGQVMLVINLTVLEHPHVKVMAIAAIAILEHATAILNGQEKCVKSNVCTALIMVILRVVFVILVTLELVVILNVQTMESALTVSVFATKTKGIKVMFVPYQAVLVGRWIALVMGRAIKRH